MLIFNIYKNNNLNCINQIRKYQLSKLKYSKSSFFILLYYY